MSQTKNIGEIYKEFEQTLCSLNTITKRHENLIIDIDDVQEMFKAQYPDIPVPKMHFSHDEDNPGWHVDSEDASGCRKAIMDINQVINMNDEYCTYYHNNRTFQLTIDGLQKLITEGQFSRTVMHSVVKCLYKLCKEYDTLRATVSGKCLDKNGKCTCEDKDEKHIAKSEAEIWYDAQFSAAQYFIDSLNENANAKYTNKNIEDYIHRTFLIHVAVGVGNSGVSIHKVDKNLQHQDYRIRGFIHSDDAADTLSNDTASYMKKFNEVTNWLNDKMKSTKFYGDYDFINELRKEIMDTFEIIVDLKMSESADGEYQIVMLPVL